MVSQKRGGGGGESSKTKTIKIFNISFQIIILAKCYAWNQFSRLDWFLTCEEQ